MVSGDVQIILSKGIHQEELKDEDLNDNQVKDVAEAGTGTSFFTVGISPETQQDKNYDESPRPKRPSILGNGYTSYITPNMSADRTPDRSKGHMIS